MKSNFNFLKAIIDFLIDYFKQIFFNVPEKIKMIFILISMAILLIITLPLEFLPFGLNKIFVIDIKFKKDYKDE